MTTSVTCSGAPSAPGSRRGSSPAASDSLALVGPVELLVYLAAYFARQAGHCLELLAGGGEKPLWRTEVLQQRPLPCRPDTRQLVEHRALQHPPVAAAAVVVDREAVRLVADPLQQPRRLRVGGEVERLRAAG